MMKTAERVISKVNKRRGHPKTKSGCKTCKTRRVKCDETHPHCLRCIKFGTECEGYGILAIPISLPGRDVKLLLPRNACVQQNPSMRLFCMEQEHRYFDIFCSKTAYEILPTFDSDMLRQVILQTCETEPSIRYAVVALGALDVAQELNFSSPECPLQHHQNALKQYTTAIKEMRTASMSQQQDLRTTLLTCLVILCFEAWNGYQDLAVKQIQMGFKLITSWLAERSDGSGGRGLPGSKPKMGDTVEDELVRIFRRLDVQAISFTAESTCQRHIIQAQDELALLKHMPSTFSSATEACIYENALMRQTMRFFIHQIPLPTPKNPIMRFPMHGWWGVKIPSVVAIQQRIVSTAKCWHSAFEPLWEGLRGDGGGREKAMASISRLRIQTAMIAAICICVEDEGVFDEHIEDFRDIIEHAEFTLAMQKQQAGRPRFTSDSLVVIPLYMVGFKCRDRLLRRRAVDMLLQNPRREGVWDSALGGKMGEWLMGVEEEFFEDGKVPVWARIRSVSMERDREERSAMLNCEQRIGPDTEEVITRRKTLVW